MGRHGTGDAARDLRNHVENGFLRRQFALAREDQCDGGIEVGSRDRPQDRNQNDEYRARRQRIAKQGQGGVFGQGLGHDAGTDHGSDEYSGPESFRC